MERQGPESTSATRAGPYLLEAEIARGGFGVVHRARHERSGSVVAVKVLKAELARDAGAVTRLEREVELLRTLGHPHLVELFENGRLDDGRPWFAMELLVGAPLSDMLAARGRVSPAEALRLLEPLADALEAAHALGVVHRDVKPSNVFVAAGREKGSVVLLDFGIAKLADGQHTTLTGAGNAVGTLAFMAPEQLWGRRVDARADVYSLAALAYRLLTGHAAFPEDGLALVRQLREQSQPAPPSSKAPIDRALDGPILAAMQRDPEARTVSARAFVAALGAAVQSASPAQPDEGPPPDGLRAALAVHVAVRARGAADELRLSELEAALPLFAAELASVGLVVARESASELLLLDLEAVDASRRAIVVAAAHRAFQRVMAGPAARGRIELGVVLHVGGLAMTETGALNDCELLDLASWVPAVTAGVVASRALFDEQAPKEPVEGAPGFFWVARG